MLVAMVKTPSNSAVPGASGKSISAKVPFKKVFSSSHLQTGVGSVTSRAIASNGPSPSSSRNGSLTHNQLASQLSSSLPGMLDAVPAAGRAAHTKESISSSQAGVTHQQLHQSVISSLSQQRSKQGIPFGAIEPSLIVSLSSYLTSLSTFESDKLVKEIELMLKYFEDVVKKNKLELLTGSCNILLETIDSNCAVLKSAYLQLQQVHLRLQILSNIHLDDTDRTNQDQSSPVIEATNDLYRSLSDLVKWADEMSLPSGEESEQSNSSVHLDAVTVVSQNLLLSFKNLVKAYKAMESELRQCYEEYLSANKAIVDLILAENSAAAAQASAGLASTLRRRSVTPPPDCSRDSMASMKHHHVTGLVNGSTSTIASSGSSNSSGSFNFLARHRFFPTVITNQAQKMAHHFEFRRFLSRGKENAKQESGDKSSHPLAFLLGSTSSLKRSESASDISSVLHADLLVPLSISTQDSPDGLSFRKRSMNDSSKTSQSEKASPQSSQSNRHSDGIDPRKSRGPLTPKEMIINPVYFTSHLQSTHSLSSDNLHRSPASGSTSASALSSPSQNGHSEYSTTYQQEKPPPLPPKTYQSRSQSSTRSSIASNASSNSSCSSKEGRRTESKDTDSGLGTMPSNSSCDLGRDTSLVLRCHNQTNKISPVHNSTLQCACTTHHKTNVHSPSSATSDGVSQTPRNHSDDFDLSQVTLRPKKTRVAPSGTGQSSCACQRQPSPPSSSSPPPLPPPDPFLFSLDPAAETSCCCHSRPCQAETNKENFIPHCGRCSSTWRTHQVAAVCPCCHGACGQRSVRTYRRHTASSKAECTTTTTTITQTTHRRTYRSYSIDDSSSGTLKSTLSTTVTDSLSPHSLSVRRPSLVHSVSIGDSSLPPPLPPKRRNMHAYMVVVGNYTGPSESEGDFVNHCCAPRSMYSTPLGPPHRHLHSVSSSVMSLSSSASSSSSLSTAGSTSGTFTTTDKNSSATTLAEQQEKNQYHHLPMAPPPPLVSDESPPMLPPRRDKCGDDLSQTRPPPPPSVSSLVVQQQRWQLQQHQSSVTGHCQHSSMMVPRRSHHSAGISPRCSTPLGHDHSMAPNPESNHCKCHVSQVTDLESHDMNDQGKGLPMVVECEATNDEPDFELVCEESLSPSDQSTDCCPNCSMDHAHSEEECILAQVDVPDELLAYRSPTDEDDSFSELDIRGGIVDALLIKATQAGPSEGDESFVTAFLTTYRAFTTPHDLLKKLIFRYRYFNENTNQTDIVHQAIARKVVHFITLLFDEIYLYDFDKSLLHTLMEFIYQLVGKGDLAHAKSLREKCYEKIKQRDREFALTINKLPTHQVTIRTFTLLEFKSEQLAEQMTLLDSQLFHKIEIPEILIWAKEQKEERIPNLSTFTEHFNKMSFWTRSQILRCEEQKEREKYVLKFLKIMKHLRKMNNFNSFLAILSALGSAPVSRLDWPKNITETLKEYNMLIDSSSSFRTYRTALAMAKPPCIPYIGLILQDLTFVHIGNSDFLPDGKINFCKHFKQYNILSQMKQFKQCKYPITENEQMINFFDNFNDYLPEEVMWQISESIKPRGGGNQSISHSTS